MNEVACRVLEIFFRQAKKEKRDEAPMLEGVPVPVSHLKSKNARMDWDVFVKFMTNVGKIWTLEQISDIAHAHLTTPLMRTFAVIPRLLFSPLDLYQWWVKPEGGGVQQFACIQPSLVVLESHTILVDLRIADGFEFCPEFYAASRGGLSGLPLVLGLPLADCTMTWTESGARYHLEIPKGGGRLGFVRRAISWPFTIWSAGKELKNANDVLQTRYRELETVRAQLDIEATKVRTAHAVSALVFRSLDIDRAITDIARALVERGGFARAEVSTQIETGGTIEVRQVSFDSSEIEKADRCLDYTMTSRNGLESTAKLYLRRGARKSEDDALEGLAEFLRPTMMMAIDNARAVLALEQSRDVLNQRLEDLAKARALAEEASRIKSEFVANMSHEIRTPLNGVLGMVQLMEGTALTTEQQEYLKVLRTSGGQLLGIVNDILDFSKIEAGAMTLELVDFDAISVCEDVLTVFVAEADKKDVELIFESRGDASRMVRGDPLRLRQILANLLSNAVKFTNVGQVKLVCQLDRVDSGVNLHLEVVDSGIGMEQEVMARVFQPFVQADGSTTRRFGGTGLGLTLTKQLIDMLHATLHVESQSGQGSRFVIDAQLELSSVPMRMSMRNQVTNALAGRSVVVVSSKPAVRDTLVAQLTPVATHVFATDQHADAMVALAQIHAANRQAVLIVDEHGGQPGFAGPSGLGTPAAVGLAAQVRRDGRFPRLPIVLLRLPTSHVPTTDRSFVDALVSRPIRTNAVFSAITDAIEQQERLDVESHPALRDIIGAADIGLGSVASALLIDANPVSRRVASHIFGRMNARLDAVDDVKSAAHLLTRQDFDVLIFDVALLNDDDELLATALAEARRTHPVVVAALQSADFPRIVPRSLMTEIELNSPMTDGQVRDLIERVRRARLALSA